MYFKLMNSILFKNWILKVLVWIDYYKLHYLPWEFCFSQGYRCDFSKALGPLCLKFIWEMRRCIGWKSISNIHFVGIWSDFQGSAADSQILIQLFTIVELKLEACRI